MIDILSDIVISCRKCNETFISMCDMNHMIKDWICPMCQQPECLSIIDTTRTMQVVK